MQGLSDIYYTNNFYIINDPWIAGEAMQYNFNNIQNLRIEPEFFYDKFLGEHLLEMVYNNATSTVEYNAFVNKTKNNNLSFIKESNLVLGIQIIFKRSSMKSQEKINFDNIFPFLYDSKEQINTQMNKTNFIIQDQWKDYIAEEGFFLRILKMYHIFIFRWSHNFFVSFSLELFSSTPICFR